MKRRVRSLAIGLLLLLAAALSGLIAALFTWGGRVEATLLVFGKPMFVTMDGGTPRILFLLALPAVLAALALRLHVGREHYKRVDTATERASD